MRSFDFYAVGDAVFDDGMEATKTIERAAKAAPDGTKFECVAFYHDETGKSILIPIEYEANAGKAIRRKVGFA